MAAATPSSFRMRAPSSMALLRMALLPVASLMATASDAKPITRVPMKASNWVGAAIKHLVAFGLEADCERETWLSNPHDALPAECARGIRLGPNCWYGSRTEIATAPPPKSKLVEAKHPVSEETCANGRL